MKKYIFTFMILTITYIMYSPIMAETIFEDSFNNTSKIDTDKTTALVDTTNGIITLDRSKLPNSVALKTFGNEYAVINGDQVNFYAFDEKTGAAVKNDLLSITDITDPVGIAIGQNDYSVWILTDKEIKRYDFTGSGMSNNPYLSVTGLTDVFSISSNSANDTVVTLSEGGAINTYKQTEQGNLTQVSQLSFSTGLENPVAVSMVPDSNDIVVATKGGLYYYSFESTSGQYVQNLMMSVVTGSPSTGLSAQTNADGYVTVGPSSTDYYMYDVNLSKMTRVPALSTSQTNYSYAISLKQGSYDYAVLTEDGQIQYWMYDLATGQMVRNSAMETAGITINRRYAGPKNYVSTVCRTSRAYDEVRIVATEDKPTGSTVKWSVSIDGGTTWSDLSVGQWNYISLSDNFIVKAILEAPKGVNQPPPKISDMRLEGTKAEVSKIECIAITKNEAEQALPTSIFPVRAGKGSQVVFAADTFGFTQSMRCTFSNGTEKDMTPQSPVTEEKNRWLCSITYEPDEQEGNITGITIRGTKNGRAFEERINSFIVINQNVIYRMNIRLTQ